MAEKEFKAAVVDFSFSIRLHDALTAFFRRKDTLRLFCHDLNIDYPVDKTKKYHFPDDGYCVRADEIEFLAKNRDKIILAIYVNYKKCQEYLVAEIGNLKNDIKKEKSFYETEKEYLVTLEKSLKIASKAIEKLDLESKISDSKTRIKNSESSIYRMESEISADETIITNNIKSWNNQVGLIDATFDTQTKKYILSATKKIRRKLGYAKFHYNSPDYSEDVKEILKGVDNV